MKKENIAMLVAAIAALITTLVLVCMTTFATKQYTLDGEIYIVDYNENLTVIKSDDGNFWGWEGTEVWPKGTSVKLVMDDNGTATHIDDKIISMERR